MQISVSWHLPGMQIVLIENMSIIFFFENIIRNDKLQKRGLCTLTALPSLLKAKNWRDVLICSQGWFITVMPRDSKKFLWLFFWFKCIIIGSVLGFYNLFYEIYSAYKSILLMLVIFCKWVWALFYVYMFLSCFDTHKGWSLTVTMINLSLHILQVTDWFISIA